MMSNPAVRMYLDDRPECSLEDWLFDVIEAQLVEELGWTPEEVEEAFSVAAHPSMGGYRRDFA